MSLSGTWFMANQYFIPHRLMLLARMIDRETARDLHRDFGITAAEWRALGYICTMGSSSAAQICVAFEVDRAEVSRAVARLLQAKLIQRGKARDRENRLTLTPTPRGEDLHDRIKAKRRTYFDWILQDLDSRERDALDGVLAKIAERVDQRRAGPGEVRDARRETPDRVPAN